MCGISGWWSFEGDLGRQKNIYGLTSALSHRGPDGKRIINLENNELQLGHTRLSIIDLSPAGSQPMPYADGRYQITFNGEIYNFLEIRKELKSYGYSFKTDTDTEVILAAYDRWREDCQFKFNGMWAFAIWDAKEKKIFLSRDRFGVKPLFYTFNGTDFIFASELKAFMALPKTHIPDFDHNTLSMLSNIEDSESTLLSGVVNLRAGCSLTLLHKSSPVVTRWWSTNQHHVSVPTRYTDQVEQYRELFIDACRIRMRSDVAVGTALSGGMDSSSVICAMAQLQTQACSFSERQASDWRKAFVLDYVGTAHSEREYAEEVIDYVKAEPYFKQVYANNVDPHDVISSIYSLEAVQEPCLGPWLIYQKMRSQGIVVSLDGHGGDEQLAGYHHYCQSAFKDSLWRRSSVGSFGDIQNVYNGLFSASDLPEGFIARRAPSRISFISNDLKSLLRKRIKYCLKYHKSLYQAISKATHGYANSSSSTFPTINHLHSRSDASIIKYDNLNKHLYNDFHHSTLPTILRNFDRVSMAHGVEIRAPFLDYRLVTYAFSLPSSSKMGSGFTKRILRDAMLGIMPDTIRKRTSKIGFASPMLAWIEGSLKSLILDSVHSQSFLDIPIWDGHQIKNKIVDAYNYKNYICVNSMWRYVQAYLLMDSFSSSTLKNDSQEA